MKAKQNNVDTSWNRSLFMSIKKTTGKVKLFTARITLLYLSHLPSVFLKNMLKLVANLGAVIIYWNVIVLCITTNSKWKCTNKLLFINYPTCSSTSIDVGGICLIKLNMPSVLYRCSYNAAVAVMTKIMTFLDHTSR